MQLKRQRNLAFGIAVVTVIWAFVAQLRMISVKSHHEAATVMRLRALSHAISDNLEGRNEAPRNTGELWRFLAGGTAIEGYLPMLCRAEDGQTIRYQALSSNSFALSYDGYNGIVRLVFDGTNAVVDFPNWQNWQTFKATRKND